MGFDSLFGFDSTLWGYAVIAFLRVATVLFFLPIFGGDGVPVRVRVLLALVMTIAVWPVASIEGQAFASNQNLDATSLAIITIREVFLGFTIGFSCRIVLFGTSIAANAIGVNMGFQTAATLSPIFDTQESVFAVFKNWFVVVLFLALNVHHKFIELLFESFRRVPIAENLRSALILENVVLAIQACFQIGIKIAAPFLVIQLFLTLALGLLSRLVPQLNAFIVSFPLSFLVSMVLLFLSLTSIGILVIEASRGSQLIISERTLDGFLQKPR